MKKLTYDYIKEENWRVVYLSEADKIYFTNKIVRSASPKTIREDVTVYFSETKEPVGAIVENIFNSNAHSKALSNIITYIKKHYKKSDEVNVPISRDYVNPLLRYIAI